MTPIEKEIQRKIEAVGVPLCDWNIQIYRGILTGYNDAFIIDTETKERLIREDPRSAEVIRPILRGRDIKQYVSSPSGLWLLFIPWHFPLHQDTNVIGASSAAEKAFEENYPVVYNHLLGYKALLLNRNKAETGVRYEWYALQRWGSKYWEDFFKPKIIWGEISDKAKFMIDESGEYFTEATTFILTGYPHLKYLLAVLNSKMSEYAFGKIGTTTGMGTIRWKKYKILDFRVPQISIEEQVHFEEIVDKIINNRKIGQNTEELEREIDLMLYNIHGFDPNEIKYIEGFKDHVIEHID